MKQTMKKCLTLLLALALLFTMAVPAAAAPATYNKKITFTDVAQGDTVKAYKLMWYSDDYNSYQYYEGFPILRERTMFIRLKRWMMYWRRALLNF